MPEPENKDSATHAATAPGAPAPGTPPPEAGAPAPDLAAQLAAAKAEAAANLDRFLRAAADLENFRRRTVREKEDLRATATGRVLEDVFPVLDTLGLAIAAARQPSAEVQSLLAGVEMVLAQLRTALAGHGLKEISPAGQPFDPHQHEAVSHQPSAEVKEEHVLAVVRPGYALNGRLLRPATVVVSSGPAPAGAKP